ncbi:hypothetical protein [Rhizobacter fulvus]
MDIESNCKAVLRENGFKPTGGDRWNMRHYRKLEVTHKLSQYQVFLPSWDGGSRARSPFRPWATADRRLPWYKAYNDAKHDSHSEIEAATFGHVVEACCALVALLYSQFGDHLDRDYSVTYGPGDGTHPAVGGYFRVKVPIWPLEERYDFDWATLRTDPAAFIEFDYQSVLQTEASAAALDAQALQNMTIGDTE